jgi:Basic region leucine zipper
MSGYHGRTGPNFSQYINNLNAVPQPYDQDFLPNDDLNLDQELALFTNTDFTDFDNLAPLPDSGLDFALGDHHKSTDNDIKYEDLLASAASPPTSAQPSSGPYYTSFVPPIQPAPPASTYLQSANSSSPIGSSPTSQDTSSQSPSLKSKADAITISSPLQLPSDQQSRLAAEEDKRRRNTAASARFRVKKKQREQALERTVKEVTDKNTSLEAKINQLELENKWLKNLITEKNGKQTKEEIAEAFRQYRRESEERETSNSNEDKEGVGTKS